MLNTEDKQIIKSAVSVFIATKNQLARTVMISVIDKVLGYEKIGFVENYWLLRNGNKIHILAREYIAGRECPGCGEDIYSTEVSIVSILEGMDSDMVTYGCSRCGEVFAKLEDNK